MFELCGTAEKSGASQAKQGGATTSCRCAKYPSIEVIDVLRLEKSGLLRQNKAGHNMMMMMLMKTRRGHNMMMMMLMMVMMMMMIMRNLFFGASNQYCWRFATCPTSE